MARIEFFRRLRTTRIRTKLILSYFLACLIPLLLSITLIVHIADRKQEDAAAEFVSAYCMQIKLNSDSFLDDFDSLTKSLLIDSDMIEKLSLFDDKSTMGKLENLIQANRMMAKASILFKQSKSISFYSAGGELYTYGSQQDSRNLEIALKEKWFQELLAQEETVGISEYHESLFGNYTERGAYSITLARRIYNYEHLYLGTLFVDFPPQVLMIGSQGLGEDILKGLRVVMLNGKGGLIYDSQDEGGLMQESSDLITYTLSTEQKDLQVHVILPRKNLRVRVSSIQMVAFLAALNCLFLVAVISFFISHGFTKPIFRLQKQMKLAEMGNYEIANEEFSSTELNDLIYSYNTMITKIRGLINDVYLADIEQKNAKLLALQTQINPHMLYNTLEAIRMKALTQGDVQVAEMVKALARMFRCMLSTEKGHTLKEEVLYTRDYMTLQDLRFPGLLSLSVSVPDQILECESLPMILQPIVENAIKHGFKDRKKPMHINLVGEMCRENEISLVVENDGQPLEEEEIDALNEKLSRTTKSALGTNKSESIGLGNIQERIQLRYGNAYGLKVYKPVSGGVGISINFPIKPREILQKEADQ